MKATQIYNPWKERKCPVCADIGPFQAFEGDAAIAFLKSHSLQAKHTSPVQAGTKGKVSFTGSLAAAATSVGVAVPAVAGAVTAVANFGEKVVDYLIDRLHARTISKLYYYKSCGHIEVV